MTDLVSKLDAAASSIERFHSDFEKIVDELDDFGFASHPARYASKLRRASDKHKLDEQAMDLRGHTKELARLKEDRGAQLEKMERRLNRREQDYQSVNAKKSALEKDVAREKQMNEELAKERKDLETNNKKLKAENEGWRKRHKEEQLLKEQLMKEQLWKEQLSKEKQELEAANRQLNAVIAEMILKRNKKPNCEGCRQEVWHACRVRGGWIKGHKMVRF